MLERRQHPRAPVSLLVRHEAAPGEPHVVDYASDLSKGGLFIRTARKPAKDDTLHVEFSPARDAKLVRAFCRVARVTPLGIGAEFLQLDPESRQNLQAVLN